MAARRSGLPTAAELDAFYQAHAPVKIGPRYSAEDRFRDFRAAFGSEEGKRVLAQIIDLCVGPPEALADVQSHATLAYRAGMRRVGLVITLWMNKLPQAQPERTEN